MTFSKRYGYEPDKKTLQFECMDDELRTQIHNTLRHFENNYFENYEIPVIDKETLYYYIWSNHFMFDSDYFSTYNFDYMLIRIKEKFFKLAWNKVYDYIEFYYNFVSGYNDSIGPDIQESINLVLEKHNAAYRMLDGKIIPISNENELDEVSEASHTPHKAINHHLKRAIEIFSDREDKDYTNVVNESIKAVEAAVNIINGTSGKTLGDALKEMKNKSILHPALPEAFNKIYGYTSDKHSGIRHAIFDGSKCIPDFADAKFMLVSCSAFINYLLQKAENTKKAI